MNGGRVSLLARAVGGMVAAALALGAGAVLRAESSSAAGDGASSRLAQSGGGHALARAIAVSMPDAIRDTGETAPSDVRVELAEDRGGTRVTLHRPRHVVAIRAGGARAVGDDWVAVVVRGGPDGGDLARLVWETMDPTTLATVRGLLFLRPGAAEPPRVAMAPTPETVTEHRAAKHLCRGHRDGAGGFTVVCSLEPEARRASVANVLGSRTLEDVWKTDDRARRTVARLDLPLSPGDARATLLTYSTGLTGVVVRAEATWVHGEPRPSLSIASLARRQPVSSF